MPAPESSFPLSSVLDALSIVAIVSAVLGAGKAIAAPDGPTTPPGDSASISARLEPPIDLRVDVAQLYSDDSLTERHLAFTDLRGIIDAVGPFGATPLEFHADARTRLPWNDATPGRRDVTRLFLQFQSERDPWFAALGRMTLSAVSAAQIDGGRFGVSIGQGTSMEIFGGLGPHPITNAFSHDFVGAGAGFAARNEASNHAGGLFVRWYQGALDRAYVSERSYLRLGTDWSLFGHAVIDLLPSTGTTGELVDAPLRGRSFLRQIDLSQGQATLRYRPGALADFSLAGSHVHTILPNRWWEDWIAEERARLGFTLDGPTPVGTRRSTARLTSNVHVTSSLTPYAIVRFDRRHEDSANGYEAQAGLKYADVTFGYLDVSGSYRRSFDAENELAAIQMGLDAFEGVSIETGFTLLRTRPESGGPRLTLYDVNASLWADLGALDTSLSGLQLLGMYQAFVDPEMIFHTFFVRIGYRFRSADRT